MVIEWNLNLEKAGGKDALKDPLGYKQDIAEVVVRSAQKSNVTQFDLYERVSIIYHFSKSTNTVSNHVVVLFLRKPGSLRNHQ